ncbi:MAG: ATP-dependent helicase, partial [Selenomonadaceae bacterium]|nr:ATP-dependent helicase [Selenomonadaceae bacterium]
LIGLVDGVLPSNCNGSDIDEEKRLLYVGITRAKQWLYLSYPRMSDNTVEFNKPCRFLAGHF